MGNAVPEMPRSGTRLLALALAVTLAGTVPLPLTLTLTVRVAQAADTAADDAERTARALADAPAPPAAIERASEAGAWWAIAQAACDADRAMAILERLNGVLGQIATQRVLGEVAERVQDPWLSEAARLRMEVEMSRVSSLQTLAGEIRTVQREVLASAGDRKPLPARLDRAHWKLAQPVRSAAALDALRASTERALLQACTDSVERLQQRFVDARTGILPLLGPQRR